MKHVAVLLPTYNSEKYLSSQIDSILNQLKVKVTVFISDDLSDDNTTSIIKEYKKKYPKKIKQIFLNKKHGSAGLHFYNLIINTNLSQYDFISFSDHDDIWNPGKLFRAISVIDFKYDGYSSSIYSFGNKGIYTYIDKSQPQTEFDYFFQSPGPGSTFVLTNSLLAQFKEFMSINANAKKIFHHDWFLYAFARSNNFNWFIDSWPSILYRQHENNQEGANLGYKAIFKRIIQIKSRWWLKEVELICTILKNKKSNNFYKRYLQNKKSRFKLIFIFYKLRRSFLESIYLLIIILFYNLS